MNGGNSLRSYLIGGDYFLKEMCRMVPIGSCPICGHKQFIVNEIQTTNYLTNMDGEVIAYKIMNHDALGICNNCNAIFRMMPTAYGFIPLTKLRSILYGEEYFEQHLSDANIKNPMEVDE